MKWFNLYLIIFNRRHTSCKLTQQQHKKQQHRSWHRIWAPSLLLASLARFRLSLVRHWVILFSLQRSSVTVQREYNISGTPHQVSSSEITSHTFLPWQTRTIIRVRTVFVWSCPVCADAWTKSLTLSLLQYQHTTLQCNLYTNSKHTTTTPTTKQKDTIPNP